MGMLSLPMAPKQTAIRTHLKPYGSLSNNPKIGIWSLFLTRFRNSRVAKSGWPRAVMMTLYRELCRLANAAPLLPNISKYAPTYTYQDTHTENINQVTRKTVGFCPERRKIGQQRKERGCAYHILKFHVTKKTPGITTNGVMLLSSPVRKWRHDGVIHTTDSRCRTGLRSDA